MSAGETIWSLIAGLAAAMDGDRESSELTLDLLEAELRSIPREGREDIRRQMIHIVAGLSRLEVRMVTTDGPLGAVV